MNKTIIIIALVAVAILTLTVVGLASAQLASPTPSTSAPNNGFWGWMGRCLGFRNSQPNGYVAPPASFSPPNQANGNYGFGPCWSRYSQTP